jgi:small subunit ribosomal protein S20
LANIKQQKKRILVAQRQRLENLRYRSSIKTYFRRLETKIGEGDADGVSTEHRQLVRLIDQAAAKRALHPNTAARKKSLAERVIARGAVVVEQPKRAAAKPAARKRPTKKK